MIPAAAAIAIAVAASSFSTTPPPLLRDQRHRPHPADLFDTDKIEFTLPSSKSLTPRTFDGFSDALKQVIDARVRGGIHFRTADVEGAVLGKKVAHWLRKHYFQPTAESR